MPANPSHDDLVWEETPAVAEPLYRIDERPASWWECLLYGWQHTLVDISPFILPLGVAAGLALSPGETASFLNYGLLAMGIATLLQTTIGNRLPIVQGPSATLTATLGPLAAQVGGAVMWGGVFLGGLFEMVVGATGILKTLRRLFPPVVSGVVVTAIGLSLGHLAMRLSIGDGSPRNWLFSVSAIALVLVLRFAGRKILGGLPARAAIFVSIWVVGLGLGGALGEVDWALLADKPWFSLPALLPFGGPGLGWKLGLTASLVVFAGYVGSMVESLGDYAATCAVAGEPYRVRHMNRGIFAEGLGAALGSLLGGLPCTSYTQNIGIIATTRVASRFVVQVAAGILILYGLSPKVGGLLVAMPRATLGGVFVLITGMIVVSGLRLLQRSLESDGDALVVGLTLILSLGLPIYAQYGLGDEWLAARALPVRLLMTNSVVLAVATAVGLNALFRGFE